MANRALYPTPYRVEPGDMEEDGQRVDHESLTSVKLGLHSAMDHLLLVSSMLLSSEWEFSLGILPVLHHHTHFMYVCQGQHICFLCSSWAVIEWDLGLLLEERMRFFLHAEGGTFMDMC